MKCEHCGCEDVRTISDNYSTKTYTLCFRCGKRPNILYDAEKIAADRVAVLEAGFCPKPGQPAFLHREHVANVINALAAASDGIVTIETVAAAFGCWRPNEPNAADHRTVGEK